MLSEHSRAALWAVRCMGISTGAVAVSLGLRPKSPEVDAIALVTLEAYELAMSIVPDDERALVLGLSELIRELGTLAKRCRR